MLRDLELAEGLTIRGRLEAAFETLRPDQWLKNVFIFLVIPYVYENGWKGLPRLIAVCVFYCMAAGSVYLFNDISDVEKDKAHPKKCYRPIPSGRLPINAAWGMFFTLTALTLAASAVMGTRIFVLIFLYLVLSHVYTKKAKHIVFIDVVCVGSLYGLRVLAGFFAVSLYPPMWWSWVGLAAILATALEVGKRQSEAQKLGSESVTRKTLAFYSKWAKWFYLACAVGIVGFYPVVAYCVKPYFATSTILVILGMVFYWRETLSLEEDLHPMYVILRSRPTLGVICLFVLFFSYSVIH